jgi:hypothetical protein
MIRMLAISAHIPHQLTDTVAAKRLQGVIDLLPDRIAGQVTDVSGDADQGRISLRFRSYSFEMQWQAELGPGMVIVQGQLPEQARRWQHKIHQTVMGLVEQGLVEQGLVEQGLSAPSSLSEQRR